MKLLCDGKRQLIGALQVGVKGCVIQWFLIGELVAWAGDDDEFFVAMAQVELHEPVILLGKAAAAGDVDENDDITLIIGHRQWVAVYGGEREVI